MKLKFFWWLLVALYSKQSMCDESLPLYFCTAVSPIYYSLLINLIGSIHATSYDDLGALVVIDLGLSAEQRAELATIEKTIVMPLDRNYSHLLTPTQTTPWGKIVPGWYAWKPVAVKQALELFPYVLWVDCGVTLLKPVNHLFKYIVQNGYFLCTIGDSLDPQDPAYPVGWGTTRYVKEKFMLERIDRKHILAKPFITANIYGVTREGAGIFLEDLCELSKNLKNYEDDGSTPNGFGTGRHDQTLISIVSYLKNATVFFQDYTQEQPINLPINNAIHPLYITWNNNYVCDKTHIYNSRSHIDNYTYYVSQIRIKSN